MCEDTRHWCKSSECTTCSCTNSHYNLRKTFTELCRRCHKSPIAESCGCPHLHSDAQSFRERGVVPNRRIKRSSKTMCSVYKALHMFFHVVTVPFHVVTLPLWRIVFLIHLPPYDFLLCKLSGSIGLSPSACSCFSPTARSYFSPFARTLPWFVVGVPRRSCASSFEDQADRTDTSFGSSCRVASNNALMEYTCDVPVPQVQREIVDMVRFCPSADQPF